MGEIKCVKLKKITVWILAIFIILVVFGLIGSRIGESLARGEYGVVAGMGVVIVAILLGVANGIKTSEKTKSTNMKK